MLFLVGVIQVCACFRTPNILYAIVFDLFAFLFLFFIVIFVWFCIYSKPPSTAEYISRIKKKKKKELAAQTPLLYIGCTLKSFPLSVSLAQFSHRQSTRWLTCLYVHIVKNVYVRKMWIVIIFFSFAMSRVHETPYHFFFECHKMRNRCQLQTFLFVLQRFLFFFLLFFPHTCMLGKSA